MSVAVGYAATQEGRAALDAAIGEAVLRKTALQIMGPFPGEASAESKSDIRQAIAAAAAAGVQASLRPNDGSDAADLIIDASYEGC